jgi:SAM-dependent methyltransferase
MKTTFGSIADSAMLWYYKVGQECLSTLTLDTKTHHGGYFMASDESTSDNPWLKTRAVEGEEYDAPYRQRERAGENVHGEADFVQSFNPASVLDAGCGTGRVGIELARRGIEVAGVDIDPRMLNTARSKAPNIDWHLGDISSIDLGRTFDAIVMAGNVMIFVTPGTEGQVLKNMARHLTPGGALIAGFQISMAYLALEEYDRLAEEAELVLTERYSTWDRQPWKFESSYAVSVHRKEIRG